MEAHDEADRIRLYNLGVVMNAAFNNPDELKKLLPQAAPVEVTGMIAIPKKRNRG